MHYSQISISYGNQEAQEIKSEPNGDMSKSKTNCFNSNILKNIG